MELLMTKVWALDFAAHRWPGDASAEAAFTTPNVKYVALAVARACLFNGACWKSQATIAAETGLSKKTVSRCIDELEAAGWLKRVGRSRFDGGRSSDRIWLTLPAVVLDAETVPSRPHRFLAGGDTDDGHDVDPWTPWPKPRHHV